MKTAMTEIKPVQPYQIKDRIIRLISSGNLAPYQVAKESGADRGQVLAWIERNIEPPAEALALLGKWYEREGQTTPTLAKKEPGYVETPTALKIIDLLDYARHYPTIVVCYGGAGVGKTTALRHYVKTRPQTWMVTAAVARRTTSSILMALVESPGIRGFAYRTDSLFSEALSMMERSKIDPINSLLIIDEAQHLETPAFDAIRAFHDEKGIGIAYVGNDEVYSRIYGKKRSRLPQIYSRVGMRLHVERSTPEDADALLEAHGIYGREERKYAQTIAATPGGLRTLTHIITYAKLVALETRSPITVEGLRDAANECGIFN